MASAAEKKLGDLLVEENVLTASNLELALEEQEESGKSLSSIIDRLGLATDWEMAAALGKRLGVPFITLSHYEIDTAVLETIPDTIVRKYKTLPVDKTGDTLTMQPNAAGTIQMPFVCRQVLNPYVWAKMAGN